ncbi:MAG TPA: alkaline phosphatase family protein [Planctomycetota bacterium]|jgi:arylsulfatase A-like enzyme|nr:alkaline phosphatase family protein [Planctomycetota bacterium]
MKSTARSLSVLLFAALVSSAACNHYARLQVTDPPPVALLSAPPPGNPRADRIIVISIDGLRPDAIEKADAAVLKMLIGRGAYCPKAETVRPSITLPSHTAMLTGLDYERHGIVWNNYRSGYIVHPTVFSVLHQTGRKSAMFFSKDKFHFLANPNCVSWIYGPPVPEKIPPREDYNDPEQLQQMLKLEEEASKKPLPPARPGELLTRADLLGRAFAESWPAQKWPLTFVHFREADEAGHRKGWMGPEYIEGVQAIDKALGSIVAAIEKNGGFERTAIIISADHGGSGRGHYRWTEPDRSENVTIPWICVAPGVPAGLRIERVIHTVDTAPTALSLIGVGAPEGIDGRVVDEVLR